MKGMDMTLFWTAFGAIGSSLGALIGVIALIIALKAYKLPMKKQLKADMCISSIVGQKNLTKTYSIKVSNVGIRPVSISNVSFLLKDGFLFLDMLWKNTILESIEPRFPVRLEQGEATTIFLPSDRLSSEMRRLIESNAVTSTDGVTLLVREATGTDHSFKTKYTMEEIAKKN